MHGQDAARRIDIIGAGIAGLWQALSFAEAGFAVTLHERGGETQANSASRWAGGMLAPWCEAEGAEDVIMRLGRRSLDLWREAVPEAVFNGTLVVSHPRDRADFDRFARMTTGHRRLDADGVAMLEPALAGRFQQALFYPQEGHVEPRVVMEALLRRLAALPVTIRAAGGDPPPASCLTVDCRGLAARDREPLRGVKGETLLVETAEISLSRPVRFLHPRWPLYVIPRAGNRFLLGATTVETESEGVSVRSALELLSAAYALHPAFAEARIVEHGSALRPAYADNLPRIVVSDGRLTVNGLYRHGFLIAPALAEIAVAHIARGTHDNEVMQWS